MMDRGPHTKTERELKRERKFLRNIMATIPDSLLILARELRIKSANRSFYKLFQTEPKKVIGSKIADILGDEDGKLSAQLARLFRTKATLKNFELHYQSEKLGERILNITGRGIILAEEEEEEEEEEELLVVIQDITEHKQAEEALRESEAKYRSLITNIPDVTWTSDTEGNIIFISPNVERLTGYTQEEEYTRSTFMEWFDRVHPDDAEQAKAAFEGLLKKGVLYDIEYRFKRKDGKWIWIYERSLGTYEKDGKLYADGLLSDITEHKQAELEYKTIIRTTVDGFWLADMQGWFLDVNDAYCQLVGYGRDELLKMRISDFEAIEKHEETMARIANIRKVGRDHFETRHRCKDGRIVDVEVSVNYIEVGERRMFVFIRDITERKRAETSLKESEERYRALVNLEGAVGEAIIMLQNTEQGEAIQTFVSDEWPPITGYTKEELLGMSFLDLLGPEYREAATKRHRRRVSGESIPELLEMSIIRKDGAEVPIELTSAYTTYKGERANVAFIRDITERKRLEKEIRELYRTEKEHREELEKEQEARGLSVNVIAHELRTPLTPLLASARLLQDILPYDEDRPEHELVELIVRGGEALSARLDELLDLARFTVGAFSMKPEPLHIEAIVRSVARQYQILSKAKNQDIVLDLPQRLPLVKADRARLEQVLTNLISNAVKFSPEAGSITIRAKAKRGKVVVEVEDKGKGLTQEEQERIFKPYHRIEQDRQRFPGLGLGLAICKQIVEAHKGMIWIESKLGHGSKFCFSLPVWNAGS